MRKLLFISILISTLAFSCKVESQSQNISKQKDLSSYEKAYFASGCFWCVEAIFESVDGVEEAMSGYSGGSADNANYSKVSSGRTNHAEAVEVYYNPDKVDYNTLLMVFFGSHDPTTLNRQGPDSGPQYRSAIFYQNDEEKTKALAYVDMLVKTGEYSGEITTEIVPLKAFYPAEDYHQDYERNNPNNGYVLGVSVPRLNKFKRRFPDILKKKDEH